MRPWPEPLSFRMLRPKVTLGSDGPVLHGPARLLRDTFATRIIVAGSEGTLDLEDCKAWARVRVHDTGALHTGADPSAAPFGGLLQFTPAIEASGPHIRDDSPPTVSVTLVLLKDVVAPLITLAVSRDNRVTLRVGVLGLEELDSPQPVGSLRWGNAAKAPLIVADGSVLIEPRRRPRQG